MLNYLGFSTLKLNSIHLIKLVRWRVVNIFLGISDPFNAQYMKIFMIDGWEHLFGVIMWLMFDEEGGELDECFFGVV